MSAPEQRGVGVAVRDLRKSYGGQLVLKGLTFSVQPGEVFVLMGPSGSGKTVLLKHLIGLETADAGEVLIEGEAVQAAGLMDRHRMAMVFQSGALLSSLSVGENVGLYLFEHRLKSAAEIQKIVAEKLTLVGLAGTEGKAINELSGGMKKRVSIARALVMEPQLILYDEPTSELDPLIAVTIGEEILKLNRRTRVTTIVVTHDRELAFGIADRIAIIHQGEILCVGRPAEVRANPNPVVQQFLSADFNFNLEPATV